VHYISQDTGRCGVILFDCPPGQRLFSDSCGCGCISSELRPCDPVTIERGVYGYLWDGCDTAGCTPGPTTTWEAGVFTSVPGAGTEAQPLASATPAPRTGFFEIALDAGNYILWAGDLLVGGTMRVHGTCVQITVRSAGVVGMQYYSGPGGGRWLPHTGEICGRQPACSFGRDQTCNDDPTVSTLWGHCNQDGTCSCMVGTINPTTGRCRP
jgi:hypothetical protein